MLHTLPAETVNQIMGHLSDDRRSLIACSSASSKLTAAARRILFFEVVLEVSSICCFLRLLDMPMCTIAPAMVRLVVRRRKRKSSCVPSHPRAHYSPQNLPSLVTGLRGVRCVKLEDLSLDNIPPPFLSLLSDLEGFKELEVHRMSFDTPIEFFRYICALPALEALSISKSSIEVTCVDIAALRPKLPQAFCIPFLDVGKLSPCILEWFLAQDPIPPVHTFRISLNSTSTDNGALRQFVDVVGPSVQNLEITLSPGILSSQQPQNPCLQGFLSSFSDIQSLRLETYLRLGEEPESYHFRGLMKTILTQIPSPNFKTISLMISLHIDETLLCFGFPDDFLLSIFDWGSSLERLCPRGVHLSMRGFPPFQRQYVEQILRQGPLVMFEEMGTLFIEIK